MKKISILNSKKIIIFILLIIGIILISPIISKEVYAKTGKLPDKLNIGLFQGIINDDIFKALSLSESIYTKTDEYIENDKYIKNHGYNVSPAVKEGDEFWTSKGFKTQKFDDNYQQAKSLPANLNERGEAEQKINKRDDTISPFVYQDLIQKEDVYCAFDGLKIFHDIPSSDYESLLGLKVNSELVKRLSDFIRQRNIQLDKVKNRAAAFNLDKNLAKNYSYLDAYGYEYKKAPGNGYKNINSTSLMESQFGYEYSPTTSKITFPYVIKEIKIDPEVVETNIVKVVGGEQNFSPDGPLNLEAYVSFGQVTSKKKPMFINAVEQAIEREIGKLYDPNAILYTQYNQDPESPGDKVAKLRTYSFYELDYEDKPLSPQAAFSSAVAKLKRETGDIRGDAQRVWWTIEDGKFSDPLSTNTSLNYMISPSSHPEAAKLKEYASAFEAYYERLKEWRVKNNNQYKPKFLETKRNIIFNAKSEKYEQGAWLIGPYKMDYLLSTVKVKNTDEDLYFAGLEKMEVFGEYTSSTQQNITTKEIKKWSYFVPLGKQLNEEELQAGVQTAKLKYGVPEPNQEFFIEIPYDENLLRIAEIKAYFKALDYEAYGRYYLGYGEYINFKVDVAVERFSKIAHGYKDVANPKITYDYDDKTDYVDITLEFDYPVYLTRDEKGATTPFNFNQVGEYSDFKWDRINDKTIKRRVLYGERDREEFNSYGFYYKYDAIKAYNSTVIGGMDKLISYGRASTVKVPCPYTLKEFLPKVSRTRTTYIITSDILFYNEEIDKWVDNRRFTRGDEDYDVILQTLGEQYKKITIEKKPPLYLEVDHVPTSDMDYFTANKDVSVTVVRGEPLYGYTYTGKKHDIGRHEKYRILRFSTVGNEREFKIFTVPGKNSEILDVTPTKGTTKYTFTTQPKTYLYKDGVLQSGGLKDEHEVTRGTKDIKCFFEAADGQKSNTYTVKKLTGGRWRWPEVGGGIVMPTDVILPKEINTNITQGKTNNYSSVLGANVPVDGGLAGYSDPDQYGSELQPNHTYVLHKSPDVLIVPRTQLEKRCTQPQVTVHGHLKYINEEAILKENLPPTPIPDLETPGFLLPIGGKVWEDRPYSDKLTAYNFIFKTGEKDINDVLLKDITVRVNRLILRRADKSIVEKQAARVFAKGEYKTPIGRDDIKTNAKGEWGKYYLRDLGFTRDEINNKKYKSSTHMVKFEVEFEYDGIKYIPVSPLAGLKEAESKLTLEQIDNIRKAANYSKAAENVLKREEFNKFIGEINGDKPMQKDRRTDGKAIGVLGVAGADTQLKYKGKLNEKNRTESTLEYKQNMRASTLNTGILYPIGDVYSVDLKQAMSSYSNPSSNNEGFDVVVIMDNDKAEQYKNIEGVIVTVGLENKSVVVFHQSNIYMENINLGLIERRPVDLELASDLMLSVQFVNKKALVNTFAEKYSLEKDPNDEFSHLISEYSKKYDDLQYKLDVYKADYVYRTAMYKDTEIEKALNKEAMRLEAQNNDTTGRELDIYLQYKQGITNYSLSDHAIITGLNMYYDKSLTPILGLPVKKEMDKEEIKDDKVTGKVAITGSDVTIGKPEYRIVTTSTRFKRRFDDVTEEDSEYKDIKVHGEYRWIAETGTNGVNKLTSLTLGNPYDTNTDILLPSLRRLEVVTNFKINNDALFKENGLEITNAIRLGNKHHLTEIAGYATYNKYTGKVTGKIDKDSAPANINLELLKFTSDSFAGNVEQNFSYLEDDSATAPIIGVELGSKDTPRKVSGMIWEEKRNYQVARVNMGDGIFNEEEGELPIPNKVVALEERVSLKAIDVSAEYKKNVLGVDNTILKDTTYYVDIPYIWDDKIEGTGIKINSLKAKTGFQSYVRTGNDGKYMFTGVPAGNFVTKLPYISVGNETTQKLGILNKDQIETTQIVDAANREKTVNVYNGQDFKVAAYNGGIKNTIQETWMPAKPTVNHSYGRDNEYQRYALYLNSKTINGKIGDALEILNVNQDKLSRDAELRRIIEKTANMTAETPLMNLGIEYYSKKDTEEPLYKNFAGIFGLPGITVKKGNIDGGPVTTPVEYTNVNIALEERPKTKLVLDKQITRLTIKQSDGTPIVDAKYNTTYDDIVMSAVDKYIYGTVKSDAKTSTKHINNTYNTEDYILRVKTELDKDSLNLDKVIPINTRIYATNTYKPYWEENIAESYTNARGWEKTRVADKISRNANGYIHLNFDKQLLSDANIEIEYQIQLYNLGEVDRTTIRPAFKNQTLNDALKDYKVSKYIGKYAKNNETFSKLNHEIEPASYGFGRYFGLGYYTGEFKPVLNKGSYIIYDEAVAKSSANKILEYVDNSAVKDDLQNDNWTQIKNPMDLENLTAAYDSTGKKTFELTAENMADPDGKSYFNTGGSNIYINEKMNTPLIPYYEYATAIARGVRPTEIDKFNLSSTIAIKRLSSQQADEDLSFDNLTELVEYFTETGRRITVATPGNVNTRISETFDGKTIESDTGLALKLTITPPTGLSKAQRTTFSTMNIMLVVMVGIAVAVIITKVVIDEKSKYKILPNELGDINKDVYSN